MTRVLSYCRSSAWFVRGSKVPTRLFDNDTPEESAASTDLFCKLKDRKGILSNSHKWCTQVQGQMGVIGLLWSDFVVWTGPGRFLLSIERIMFDQVVWDNPLSVPHFLLRETCPPIFQYKQGLSFLCRLLYSWRVPMLHPALVFWLLWSTVFFYNIQLCCVTTFLSLLIRHFCLAHPSLSLFISDIFHSARPYSFPQEGEHV